MVRRLTGVTDPFGRPATFTYAAAGQLGSITDVGGLTSSFACAAGPSGQERREGTGGRRGGSSRPSPLAYTDPRRATSSTIPAKVSISSSVVYTFGVTRMPW